MAMAFLLPVRCLLMIDPLNCCLAKKMGNIAKSQADIRNPLRYLLITE